MDIKINASDIMALAEDGDVQGTVEKFLDDVLVKAVEVMKENDSSNFIIGKVIIENDLESDEDEEEEESEE